MQQSYLKWIIGVAVILVAGAAVSMLNFGDNIVYFYTPKRSPSSIHQSICKDYQGRWYG